MPTNPEATVERLGAPPEHDARVRADDHREVDQSLGPPCLTARHPGGGLLWWDVAVTQIAFGAWRRRLRA